MTTARALRRLLEYQIDLDELGDSMNDLANDVGPIGDHLDVSVLFDAGEHLHVLVTASRQPASAP